MATFEYTARIDPSRMQEGTIEAESAMSAARHLKAQGLYPIRVETCSRGARRFGWLVGRWRFGRVGLAALAEFTDQLADLLEAGFFGLRIQICHHYSRIWRFLMERMEELENRSIYIIREAYACFSRPAVLWSMGKDSTVLIALCRKAFLGTVPFPVVHIDTGRKFPSMYAFRDKWAQAWGLELLVAKNTASMSDNADYADKLACCTALKTEALKQLLHDQSFDAIMLAIRADEHGIRAKERHFSPRDMEFQWNYRNQPPELWDLFEARADNNTHIRVHPLLDWTELDIWRYIKKENLPIVDLYFAKEGKRYRSIGCSPCCEPVSSDATTLDEILHELETTKVGERQGRAQDKEAPYAMQQLRALGYM